LVEEEKPAPPAKKGKGKGKRPALEAKAKVVKAKAKVTPATRSKRAIVRSGGNPEADNQPSASAGGSNPPVEEPLPPAPHVLVPLRPPQPPPPPPPGLPVDLHAKVDYAVSVP
jgi:hypothetical protein